MGQLVYSTYSKGEVEMNNNSTWEFGTRQVVYGPIVGFLAGLIGNTLGDLISGFGFYWNWSLGSGLMGMVPGLIMATITDFKDRAQIIKAVGWGTLGIVVGMLF